MTMMLIRKLLLVGVCLTMCSAWSPGRPGWSMPTTRRLAAQSDDFPAWEAAMVQEHKKDCANAKQMFATVETSTSNGIGEGGDYTGGWDAFPVGQDCVGLGNAPYLTAEGTPNRDLIHVSKEPVLTGDECDTLVAAAEKRAVQAGWGSRYTYAASSHEVHVADCGPVAKVVLDTLLSRTLLPALAALYPGRFGSDPSKLRVYNALVVKYDASTGRNAMPVHTDFGLLTLNICLNELGQDYQGGGTWFQALDGALAPSKGSAIAHASPLAHSGCPTSSGERYQLVVFVLHQDFPDVGGRLQHLGSTMLNQGNDTSAALRALRHSVRSNNLDPETWFQLGRARQAGGDFAGAGEAYSRAVGIGAGGSKSLLNVEAAASKSAQSGDAKAAAREAAVAALKECSSATEHAGVKGEGKEGDEDRQQNLSFEAVFSLACTMQALNFTSVAGDAFRLCLEMEAPPGPNKEARETDAQHNWALTLMAQELFEDAGLILEQVVEVDPLALESWASLGMCMVKMGQPLAAKVCQSKVVELQASRSSREDDPLKDSPPIISME